MTEAKMDVTSHVMNRLDISTGMKFEEFRSRFEEAAPSFDADVVERLVQRAAPWEDMQAAVREMAPHALIRYVTIDAGPVMALAGNRTQAVEYLLGNHVIAETMFRHDPHAMLYAPLRVLLYSNAVGEAVFSIDQPSTVFGSLGIDEVTEIALGLDDKVAALLAFLLVVVAFPPQSGTRHG
ncbi:DUF302 domain-containing protein [uncultured Williamsia sp.]|uniref:DUF302 domain-containing protein n=1 Tax=uncultured Williamsia sp. TaxID=259311 RepID=UPI00260D6649|nr:DUF302 domain-containing protein [uncultured Williamsia sp.]